MIDFLQWIGAIGGVGAVFAVMMFLVNRQTNKTMRDDRKYMEDRMSDCLDNYNKSVTDNTKILSELYTYLKAKNGGK